MTNRWVTTAVAGLLGLSLGIVPASAKASAERPPTVTTAPRTPVTPQLAHPVRFERQALRSSRKRKVDLAAKSATGTAGTAAPGSAQSLVLTLKRRKPKTRKLKVTGLITVTVGDTAAGTQRFKLKKRKGAVGVGYTVPLGLKAGNHPVKACITVTGKNRDTKASNDCATLATQITITSHPTTDPGTNPDPDPDPSTLGTPVPIVASPPVVGPKDGVAPHAGTDAPDLPRVGTTSFRDSITFLFTGASPIQTGVNDPESITEVAAALVHGVVVDTSAHPVGGVRVDVLGHPELGRTATASDGTYALAVNGGGPLVLRFQRSGFLPVQRTITPAVLRSTLAPDIALKPYAGSAYHVDLTTGILQAAQGATETDASGSRQPLLLFQAGTTATEHLPDGSTKDLGAFDVRATEYTVGDAGPAAMPGTLPPTTEYTYASAMTIDQAVEDGATTVTFDKPVVTYLDNFLGFPVGAAVPSGTYDPAHGAWKGSTNGVVLKVLSISGGQAAVAVDQAGTAATPQELRDLGITTDELTVLANRYPAGSTLWRVPLAHFSSWDFNFLPEYRRPDAPDDPQPNNPPQDQVCRVPGGSSVLCDSRAVAEDVPVAGTPYSLHYQSDSVAAYHGGDELMIPVTPASGNVYGIDHVDVDVDILGRSYHKEFCLPGGYACADDAVTVAKDDIPTLTDTIVWDRKDGFGRDVSNSVTANVTVTYQVQPLYSCALGGGSSPLWAAVLVSEGCNTPARGLHAVSSATPVPVGPTVNVSGNGLGDWDLDVHDTYDPVHGVLHRGTGEDVAIAAVAPTMHFLGGGGSDFDDPPATVTDAWLGDATALLARPDGSILYADCNRHQVLRVAADETVSTFAGNGTGGTSGDGGPAPAAEIDCPTSMTAGPDGSVYFVDDDWASAEGLVRRVAPDGTISTFAGGGDGSVDVRDGGAATKAEFGSIAQVAMGPDGGLVLVGNLSYPDGDWTSAEEVVARIDPTGHLTLIPFDPSGVDPDSLYLQGIALGPNGETYVSDQLNNKVYAVSASGVTVVAGNGTPRTDGSGNTYDTGDGGAAVDAAVLEPTQLFTTADGSLYVTESASDDTEPRVRRISASGTITTFAGGGTTEPVRDTSPAATSMNFKKFEAAAPAGDNTLLVAMKNRNAQGGLLYRVTSAPTVANGALMVPVDGGSRIDVFDARGVEQSQYDAMTGIKLHDFVYDSAGRLTEVTDHMGRATTIDHDASGLPTSITGPDGHVTTLDVDGDGRLTAITDPLGNAHRATYDAAGQMAGFSDPVGNTGSMTYDSLGRIVTDTDPGGGVTTLASSLTTGGGHRVTATLPGGRTQVYENKTLPNGSRQRTVTDPTGARSIVTGNGSDAVQLTAPDGTVTFVAQSADPRFGMAAPVPARLEVIDPHAGNNIEIDTTRTVTLATPDDPLSITAYEQDAQVTHTLTTHGISKVKYDVATRTGTITTAEGRVTTVVLDTHGLVTKITRPTSSTPLTIGHDAAGRITTITQGSRTLTYGYDAAGNLTSATDAAGDEYQYAYDAAGRRTEVTTPLGDSYQLGYDDVGNAVSLTDPASMVSAMTWSDVGLMTSFARSGTAQEQTFGYDAARNETSTGLATGDGTTATYDGGGRPRTITTTDSATTLGYDPQQTQLVSAERTTTGGPTARAALTYDGGTLIGLSTTGPGAATHAYTYTDGRLSKTVEQLGDASTTTARQTDQDGLLTAIGPFTLSRAAASGQLTAITDTAGFHLALTQDAFGAESGRTLELGSTTVADDQLSRDAAGRIDGLTRTTASGITTSTYTHDKDSRLTSVSVGGSVTEKYTYDATGNLTSRPDTSGAALAITHDMHGNVASVGGTAYTFDAAGRLTGRGSDTFAHDSDGTLHEASVGGSTVSYAYDAFGRRVARTVGGQTEAYLYGNPRDALEVTASIAADGTVTHYTYDDRQRLISIERGGTRYAVATDIAGTPLAVAKQDGTVVKTLDYDAYGQLLSDTAPAFALPIGWQGGLSDPLTGLVHFGARDYDPLSGRFVEPDPALLDGGPNLYEYADDDPVDLHDRTGLAPTENGSGDGDQAPPPPPTFTHRVATWSREFKDWVRNTPDRIGKWIDQKEQGVIDLRDACNAFFRQPSGDSMRDLQNNTEDTAVPIMHQIIDWATGKQTVPITPGDAANQALDRGIDAAHEMRSFGAESSQLQQVMSENN